ncbi:MAG: hypothetical protein U0531_21905 [Dehalococcoidia bacterium]
MPRTCQLGRFYARCRLPTNGVCQYCGRSFCTTHGRREPDGDEVCVREVCGQKHADLREHLDWKARAVDRSNRGFCGMPDCDGGRWGQCSKCLALFCERHLHAREEQVRHGIAVFRRPASMCDHCLARNRLWARR